MFNIKSKTSNKCNNWKNKTWIKRIWDIFTEPMMFLILATAVVYFFVGETTETIIFLLYFLAFNIRFAFAGTLSQASII